MNHFERILAQRVSEDASGCWLYLGGLTSDGYANLRIGGRSVQLHRASYEDFVGPIPAGLVLDHLCRVRHCINPWHLDPVTVAENNARSREPQAIADPRFHCVNGHAFTVANTYIRPTGHRDCRTCVRGRAAAYRARKSVAA